MLIDRHQYDITSYSMQTCHRPYHNKDFDGK